MNERAVEPLDDEEIEAVFKVELPVTQVIEGSGYYGVLLRNKSTDTLQCHLCGKYFKSLSSHINKHHKMSTREYRFTFQLPLGFPLVSLETSRKISAINKVLGLHRHLDGKRLKVIPKAQGFAKEYGRNNASFENKFGLCQAQIRSRYEIVKEIVGREPKQKDIEKYDHSLWGGIRRRHGSLNKYRKEIGVPEYTRKWDKEIIIAALRKYFFAHNKISIKDFRWGNNGDRPNVQAIQYVFGSWRKAVAAAGLT